MSYSEWTETSSTYRAYRTAVETCETQMAPLRLTIALRAARATENALEGRARKHARWTREDLEAKLRKAQVTAGCRPKPSGYIQTVRAELAADEAKRQEKFAAMERAIITPNVRMATEPMLRLIVRLEKARMRSGDDSGFQSARPSTREQLNAMTFEKASQRITSLKGGY